ncbi:Fe-S cluster assembly protein SufD [Marisediminicola senii]|uniref:Fe-S cluster assembly protein SufD n=1 Tax=Marisediminicola senii TaxID=2711233 RepID=UPI0013EC9DB5|nr:Fe-S cluster assembly protein SufD [Marisediminicola senii]
MTSATPVSVADAIPEQHGAKPHTDSAAAFVPVQTRSERFRSTRMDDFPAINGTEIAWKLSPVAKLRPLIDGDLDGSTYPYDAASTDGIAVEWVERGDARIGVAGASEERASANAWSTFESALAITVSGEESQQATVTRSALGSGPRAAHTVITAKRHSRGHVVLLNTGDAMLSENVEIVVEDGAHLTVVTVQQWAHDAIHLASHFANIGRDAVLRHVVVSLDGDVIRINPSVHLVKEGGDVELLGAYFATAGQHIEQQVFVDHDAANTRSRVSYKGALQGVGARTVWIGDVLIRQTGVATDSYEQNRNLLLTEGARADSIPNLEIETGDIAGAGHASASGRFDDEQLFYLQARGITEEEARRLVVRGFLADVIRKIGSPTLEDQLESAIESALVPEGTRRR